MGEADGVGEERKRRAEEKRARRRARGSGFTEPDSHTEVDRQGVRDQLALRARRLERRQAMRDAKVAGYWARVDRHRGAGTSERG